MRLRDFNAHLFSVVCIVACGEPAHEPPAGVHEARDAMVPPAVSAGGSGPTAAGSGEPSGSGGAAGVGVPGGTTGLGGSADAAHDSMPADAIDAGDPTDPDVIGVFVAQGHVGRFVMSCDDGRTWPFDTSKDDALRCWSDSNLPDCDHHAWAGNGIAYGNGAFVATFGWGNPGGLFRSVNGRDWAQVTVNTWFAGVAYGNGRWVAGSGVPYVSTDGAQSFDALEPLHYSTARRTVFADVDGGRFVIVADQNTIRLSSDDGGSFWEPSVVVPECGREAAAGGNGVLVLLQGSGVGCRSTDGGDTWAAIAVGGDIRSNLVFTGSEFMVWGLGVVYRSNDGESWTSAPTLPGSLDLVAVATSPSGTFVGAYSPWAGYYDVAKFFRSADGVNWEEPEGSDVARGHPLRAITYGYVNARACE